jgi:hypothetical protein
VFLRYSAPNNDGAGGVIEIMSSGVLSAPGVEVAQADFVDPDEVEFTEFEDSLSTQIDIIGSDWKVFNNTTWLLANDRAYFVKTPNGVVWKLIFLEFGGSSTGNVVFSKELVEETGVGESSIFDEVLFYPNPCSSEANLLFSVKNAGQVRVQLSNIFGQTVWSGTYQASPGFNAAQLALSGLPNGQYLATLSIGDNVLTSKFLKQN